MTIKEYAKAHNHGIVGKLTRHPEAEWYYEFGKRIQYKGYKVYLDEAQNEYSINKHGVCIITADGNVI